MHADRFTFTLNALVASLNKAADGILRARFGLTYSQFLFLVKLDSAGTVSQGVLAERLGVSKAAVSKRVSWFVDRGLARLGPAIADLRVVTLRITPEGHRLVEEMSDVLEEKFRTGLGAVQGIDLDELNQTLHHLHALLVTGEPNLATEGTRSEEQ